MTLARDRPDLVAVFASESGAPAGTVAAAPPRRGPITHPQAPGLDVVGAGAQVPLATGGTVEYANLDHGASAPALRAVRDTVDALLDRYASVHRGAGWHSKVCTSLYEGAREPVRTETRQRESALASAWRKADRRAQRDWLRLELSIPASRALVEQVLAELREQEERTEAEVLDAVAHARSAA